ncbi:MAG TPA: CBS domain-containing protein [Steroidobacteraceae bacterium]|nr:CBS domain-containing protein [Steroidobacteraceae bacterium]
MATVRHLLDAKPKALWTVEPDDPVLEVIQRMADHHVGALPVLRGEELVGIVSERDYARKVVLLGRSATETPVWQIMSAPVITVTCDTALNDCLQLVTEHRVRHLPVLEAGRLIGMISIGDLVKAVIDEQQHKIEDLERYIRSG